MNKVATFAIYKATYQNAQCAHYAKTHLHIAQYVMQKPNQHSAMAGLLCGSAVEQHYPGVSANHCALP